MGKLGDCAAGAVVHFANNARWNPQCIYAIGKWGQAHTSIKITFL
jgi:hypothetical protein